MSSYDARNNGRDTLIRWCQHTCLLEARSALRAYPWLGTEYDFGPEAPAQGPKWTSYKYALAARAESDHGLTHNLFIEFLSSEWLQFHQSSQALRTQSSPAKPPMLKRTMHLRRNQLQRRMHMCQAPGWRWS